MVIASPGYVCSRAARKCETFTSTVTSSICECPVASHRIRLLVPAALPSTTICTGEVARVSMTAGLLDKILVTGDCRLMTTDFPTKTCNACPSAWAAAGTRASNTAMPRVSNEVLSCPNAKVLIVLRYKILALEFLNRTRSPLDHFHQINRRCRCGLAWAVLDAGSSHHRRWFAPWNQFLQPSRAHFRGLLVCSAAQHELDVSLAARQLQFLGILGRKQQCDYAHLLRLALWIRLDRLSCSQHFHVLQHCLGERSSVTWRREGHE